MKNKKKGKTKTKMGRAGRRGPNFELFSILFFNFAFEFCFWCFGKSRINWLSGNNFSQPYNQEIGKFQEWGFYQWGTFYSQGVWNEELKTMFYHTEDGQPTAKLAFNEDNSASLEMLNLNNGDFFIWKAKITSAK